jgi:hypothetical protein
MSDSSNETAVDSASAFMNADVFYQSAPNVPTDEAGESPEVEAEAEETETEEVEVDEVETTAETETDDGLEADSTRYSFDEESGEYTFKAAGKDVTANTEKLIELASKGIGFEKGLTKVKRKDESRATEHAQAMEAVKQRESQLEAMIDSLGGLIEEEKIDETLLDDNPGEYIKQEKRIRERKAKLVEAQRALQGKREQAMQVRASKEAGLFKEMMGWESDEDVVEGFKPIDKYLKSINMTQKEVGEVLNHKVFKAFSDAAKYQELQAKKEKAVKEVKNSPKSVKSKKASKPKTQKTAVDILYGT